MSIVGAGKGSGPTPVVLCSIAKKRKQPTGQGTATNLERMGMCMHIRIVRYTRAQWVQVKG